MARTSKPKTETSEPTSSTPAVSTATLPSSEQKETKPRAPRVKKEKEQTVSEVVSEPVKQEVTVTSASASTTTPSSETVDEVAELSSSELSVLSSEFLTKLNNWVAVGSSLKAEFKALEKRWNRELKNAQKNKKRTKRGGNKSPSGFVKPTKISVELAKFLNKPDGSEMARTEVTKEINNYIKSHNLQDPDNGRHIVPDAKLASLLKIEGDDKLTYFNLQKYMSQHFIKTPKPVSA